MEYLKSAFWILLVLWLASLHTLTSGLLATGVLVGIGIYGARKNYLQYLLFKENKLSKSAGSV